METLTIQKNLARARRIGHLFGVYWLTGLPSSGKSTIAYGTDDALLSRGYRSAVLDSDDVRKRLSSDLKYSDADRLEHVRRLAQIAAFYCEAGLIVSVPATANYKSHQSLAREVVTKSLGSSFFKMVYVSCALETCEARDPKGYYKLARAEQLKGFTGIETPYEAPDMPDLTVKTDAQSSSQSIDTLFEFVLEHCGPVRLDTHAMASP